MSIKIEEIKNKYDWDDFVTTQEKHTFLHSWAWGEFNKAMGDTVWRLGMYKQVGASNEEQELVAVALVIKVHARRGNFLFVPHGPIIKGVGIENKILCIENLTQKLKEIAEKERDVVFIRISPLLEDSEENKKIFKESGFRNAPIYMHPETTWQLDLIKDEQELMQDMRKNTRNLIRRAEKDGVKIVSSTSEEFVEEFFNLYKETAGKHGFTPFPKKYLKEEIHAFGSAARVYLAKYNNKTLSGAIFVQYGSGAFYHHGASSQEYAKIPSVYLLLWQSILDAKRNGKTHYNFWGIAKNDKDKTHPWYGLTFFKQGFGGYRTDYLHAQDIVVNQRYWINYTIEKIRMMKRGV